MDGWIIQIDGWMDKTNRWMVGRKTKLFKKQMVVWMDIKKYIDRYQNGRLDG